MKMTKKSLTFLAAGLAAAWLAAGCASPGPQYYSLADTAAPGMQAPATAGGAASLAIALAPVTMPERFMRPQLVVRRGDAAEGPQVEILEQHRWSASFEEELRDALGSGIAARLGAVDATRSGVAAGRPMVHITVQMRHLDAIEGRRVDAGFSWSVRRDDAAQPLACRLSLSNPVAGGIDALALGTQQAAAALADAIARSISTRSCPA